MKHLRIALMMTTGLMVFAACSGESKNGSDSVVGTQPADATSQTVVADVTVTTLDDITDVAHPPASGDFVGALADVTEQTCEQEEAGWRVTGVVTNPTAASVDYRIYISLLNGSLTTRALVETELLAVAVGANATFDELVALPDDDLRCVLRVERRVPGL